MEPPIQIQLERILADNKPLCSKIELVAELAKRLTVAEREGLLASLVAAAVVSLRAIKT